MATTLALRLFIQPTGWSLDLPYGPSPAGFSHLARLKTSGDNTLYAAATGKLSLHRPKVGGQLSGQPLPDASGATPSEPVTIYLHPSPLGPLVLGVGQQDLATGFIEAFVYDGVDPSSLLDFLGSCLDAATLYESGTQPDQVLSRSDVVAAFLRGERECGGRTEARQSRPLGRREQRWLWRP
jgi:hypothetical protein